MKRHHYYSAAIILLLVGLDQLTKQLVARLLTLGQEIVIIPGFFTLTSHRNTGAAWGILDGNMIFFYLITIFAGGLFYWLIKDIDITKKKFYATGILLMIAGGIGNFIDRLLFQEVIDFIDIDLWSYTTFPIFNIADICLVVGMIIFAIDILIEDVLTWIKSRSQKNTE